MIRGFKCTDSPNPRMSNVAYWVRQGWIRRLGLEDPIWSQYSKVGRKFDSQLTSMLFSVSGGSRKPRFGDSWGANTQSVLCGRNPYALTNPSHVGSIEHFQSPAPK